MHKKGGTSLLIMMMPLFPDYFLVVNNVDTLFK